MAQFVGNTPVKRFLQSFRNQEIEYANSIKQSEIYSEREKA